MLILKFLGVFFILTGSVGLGIYYSGLLNARQSNTIKIRRILELIASEVSYSRLPIDQILERLSARCDEPFSLFLSSVAYRLSNGSGTPIYDIWREEEGKLSLDLIDPKVLAVFMEVPLHIGFHEADTQKKAFESLSERLKIIQEELLCDASNKKKLYVTIGAFAGAMCAVWLW